MSNTQICAGPLLQLGMVLSTRASELAVATSPSRVTRSIVPVGKNGRNSLNDFGSSFGSAVMTENCSKKTAGEWKLARKQT